jgi:hypothetical protein
MLQVHFKLPRCTERGKVGEKIDWIVVAPKTGVTPKKKVVESYKLIDHHSLDNSVRERHENCKGVPMKRFADSD